MPPSSVRCWHIRFIPGAICLREQIYKIILI
nr:MAG TPA: hypothetical protein [Caudoviricetes sp.]